MPPAFPEYTVKWASLPWEVEEAGKLRERVFCNEQQVFEKHDRDEIDDRAIVLVAIGCWGGWHDRVVGTVRIHREQYEGEEVWYGSRLAVDRDYRREAVLGATLIRLAVSSASALGCTRFLANVQSQNERLFQRLHWHTLARKDILGHEHAFMQADLAYYPPCDDPVSGFVVRAKRRRSSAVPVAILDGETFMPHYLHKACA